MFDGSVSWSVGVGEGEWSWRALGAPKRLWSDGFVMIDGVFVVAVGVSAEEGGEWPRGGGAVVRMRGWMGVWSSLARDEWLVVLWLTLAWTVCVRRVRGAVGGAGMRGGCEGACGRRY